jgi:PhnB protein
LRLDGNIYLKEEHMAVKPIPEGYHTITPILVVDGGDAELAFLKQAFGAKELFLARHADGKIWHSELQIGDSRVMLADANAERPALKSSFTLYVENVDDVHRRAVAAGAVSLREPTDQFYGDRTSGVLDACGNSWWLSTHVEDVSEEELQRRMKAMGGAS